MNPSSSVISQNPETSQPPDRPLRILHAECSLNWGGQESRICQEALWLNRNGHLCWVACPPHSEIFRRGRALGVPVLPVWMRNSADLRGLWALRTIVRENRVQLINTHGSKDSWLCLPFRLGGIPVVRSRHITDPVRADWRHSWGYRHGCTRVVATAECIRRDLIAVNQVDPCRIEVIGEGVDTAVFRPPVDGSAFRLEYGIAPEAPLFGVIGMIRWEKGQDLFVLAALEVLRTHPHARFVLVGEGTGEKKLERRCRQMIQKAFGGGDETRTPVFMAGFRENVHEVMAAMEVVVVPSRAEAQSRVIPESFALGLCVIASAVGGIPELVEDHVNGLLVAPEEPAALAAAMRKTADDGDLRTRLGRCALELAQTRLSFERRMAETVELYRKIMKDEPELR